MTRENKSISTGISMMQDGILDYHKVITDKMKSLTVGEAKTEMETLAVFKDDVEGIMDALNTLSTSMLTMEGLFLEYELYTTNV